MRTTVLLLVLAIFWSDSPAEQDRSFDVPILSRLPVLSALHGPPPSLRHSVASVETTDRNVEARMGLITLELGKWRITIPQCLAKLSEATHEGDVEISLFNQVALAPSREFLLEVRVRPSEVEKARPRVTLRFRFQMNSLLLLSFSSNLDSPGSPQLTELRVSRFCQPSELELMRPQLR